LDRFPGDLSYSLHLLIGFNAIEVDYGGRLTTLLSDRILQDGRPEKINNNNSNKPALF
jgi:hypothetical protein